MRYCKLMKSTHTPSHGLLGRDCAISTRYEALRTVMTLTMILLSRALAALSTIRTGHDMLFKETLLAFSDPPIPEAVQQHLRGAHSTYPRPRCIGIRVDAPRDRVEIHEEVQFDEWRKPPWLGLHMRDNLLKIARTSWCDALVEMLWDVPLGICALARGLAQSSNPA